MKTIHFYFDFISPYAWLGFDALPQALQGISHRVVHKPVLFAAMLKHHGQLGPAEMPSKRDWTYRQVLWLARQQGTALQLPAMHPFNPLGLLRLAIACGAQGQPSRYVCEKIFRHVWCTGQDAADAERLPELAANLNPAQDASAPSVKQALQAHSAEAIALGVFGVPTWVVDGRLFWGQDALPMLRAYLQGDAWFDGPDWQAPAQCKPGGRR
ncbi:2-hydroxychromene-2-carboxylate isomerase [uncultured Limnohabitans sp.]|jgi:2-hydroxychromene-2-carboxylate isomerase|uniref:2-hydroxychromene-2-carboxylate isomerase n=1 Tax=uncultured Limnohabitans sp. TaxID=768543 RepID=UPI002636D40F|nr:2-hydroxychromene-2-carboxylate isomerase [uncultured Limnohabitans sp.]